jgi:hypothetical protein
MLDSSAVYRALRQRLDGPIEHALTQRCSTQYSQLIPLYNDLWLAVGNPIESELMTYCDDATIHLGQEIIGVNPYDRPRAY